jgi:hypothetical protein
MERLCKKCILPENYSGISFNEHGICNFCEEYKPLKYLGEDRLKEDISIILKNKIGQEYDCIVAFSGGRDSTYLLWYVVNVLQLKPLAVFVDSKAIPKETLSSINKTIKILDVDLIIKQHDYLQKSINHNLKIWLEHPYPSDLIDLCSGCRLGMSKLVREEAVNRNIPIVFAGGTPFEKGLFKKNLIPFNRYGHGSFILRVGKQVIRNPSSHISNFDCLKIKLNEYITTSRTGYLTKSNKNDYVQISPFVKYFRWKEKKVDETIKSELEWKPNTGLKSSYRGDCDIGIVRQYLYYKMLGYNDKDDHLSWLVRDGQISREEALKRVKKERVVGFDILKSSFGKLGVDFSVFNSVVEKNARKYNIPYRSKGLF